MHRTGADDNCARRELDEPPQPHQRFLAVPLAVRSKWIGQHHDRGARGARDVARTGNGRGKLLDRRRLGDVERLSLGGPPGIVNQRDRSGGIAPRQPMRQRPAQLAGTDDRHLEHV